MATNVGSVTNHFPRAQNGFTTTTAGSVASGATTVQLASVSGYTNGEPAVFVIDPTDATKKQTFTGIIDTSGVQVTSVVWTAGTNQTHALGATVVDYATATHISMMSKGIRVQHKLDGTHSAITADSVTAPTGTITALTVTTLTVGSQTPSADWTASTAPNTVTYNGNHSYDLVFNGTDLTGSLNPGTRFSTTRTVAAPTQCTSLNGTTQYFNKTSPAGMTFTDDFAAGAWVKLTSYANGTIMSRYNGTSGWILDIISTGQIVFRGYNASNANQSNVTSYQSVPLNRWVHIAAQLDMSAFTATPTTSYIMLDGVDIPAQALRSGTNPTALIQAGNLEVGSQNGGTVPFAGKISQAFVASAKITQSNVRTLISQGLTASLISTHSIVSAYSFDNSINDLNTTNANNLTANGSAVATNADSPFGLQASGLVSSTLDYGIVQAATFATNTTVTVQVPEGNTIPTSGGVTATRYSSAKAPYGFPSNKTKWLISTKHPGGATSSNATYGTFLSSSFLLTVPIGGWRVGWQCGSIYNASTTNVYFAVSPTSLSGLSATAGFAVTSLVSRIKSSAAVEMDLTSYVTSDYTLTAQAAFVMYTLGATTAAGTDGSVAPNEIFAENAYL